MLDYNLDLRMSPELKNIESARKILETMAQEWTDSVIPNEFAVLGAEQLKIWKEKISLCSSDSKTNKDLNE